MNRKEFIRELDNNLRDMDLDERKEVVRYYEEIFDGAEENGEDIEKLTEKLGSPFEAAENIKKESGMLTVIRNTNAKNAQKNSVKEKLVLNTPALVFAIIASPFLIALAISFWAIGFTIVAAMGAFLLSVCLAGLAITVVGFVNIFTATATGFAFFGLGIIGCAIGLFIFKPIIMAIKICAVGFGIAVINVFKAMLTKKVPVGEGV